MKYSILLTLLFALAFSSFSQNEANQWHFGINVGLSFNSSPPTVVTSSMIAQEGSASIADATGNLLFYTNGNTVYNQQHQTMANGTGLFGGNLSSTQAALILQKPGSQNLYYIFTTEQQAGTNGFCYSIVDMSLAAGMGSVTTKNVLLQTPSTEKLTAVYHCNGVDIWVISHDWNSANFRCFLLTAAGITNPPVLSSVGSIHTGGIAVTQGNMKASPDGQKLGLALYGLDRYELFDFDNSTGLVSNLLILTTTTNKPYGCEFSSDSKKFYGSSEENPGIDNLFQWDLSSGTPSVIIASETALSNTVRKGALQLAPDGKIYVARLLVQYDLGVINNPNAAGTACNYVDQGLSLGQLTGWAGLPNFMSSYFNTSLNCSINYTVSDCFNVSFAPSKCSEGPNSTRWIFGDPGSGAANTSINTSPVHTYPGNGSYLVQLMCGSDTISKTIILNCFDTGLGSNVTHSGFRCSPNPFREQVTVVFSNPVKSHQRQFSLHTICGQEMATISSDGNDRQLILNLGDLPAGIYFLNVREAGKPVITQKLVKE